MTSEQSVWDELDCIASSDVDVRAVARGRELEAIVASVTAAIARIRAHAVGSQPADYANGMREACYQIERDMRAAALAAREKKADTP